MKSVTAETTAPGRATVQRLMPIVDVLRLARQHLESGALHEAEELAMQVARARNRNPDAFHLLGVIAFRQRKLDKAIAYVERAIALSPRTAAFHGNLAEMLRRRGFIERGLAAGRRAVALDPRNAQAWNNLGILEYERRAYAEAEHAYRRALDIDPRFAPGWNNLGNALVRLGRDEEGHAAYARAIALMPGYGEAMVNDALCFREEQKFVEAEGRLLQAIEVNPRDAHAHLVLATVKFLIGKTAEARREYEWRLALPRARPRGLPGAVWRGEPLEGKRLLLHAEQGLGDTLHALRYLRRLGTKPAGVTLLVQRNLRRLVEENFPEVEVLVHQSEAVAADYHAAMMSLPFIISADETGEPYLAANAERAAAWRERLAPFAGRKIGLVWAGNRAHQNDHARSIRAENLRRLVDAPDCTFFSLQIGPAAAQFEALKDRVIDLSESVATMSETAAAISALDLVISVDTSIAHLAGALGTPVWTLLSRVPDWRWGLAGETTPLYRSMRLFRQPGRGDWTSVLDAVQTALDVSMRTPVTGETRI